MKVGFGGTQAPRTCDNKPAELIGGGTQKCPLDPYKVCADKCLFID